MKFGSRKTTFLVILLSYFCLGVASCPRNVPPPPEHWQCQFNGNPRAFYCENSVSHERLKVPVSAPSMKAAQCLAAPDYQSMENWVAQLKEMARARCK
jgi:hypothetical protein